MNKPDEYWDSSWDIENRIDQDWCWDLPAESAVREETVKEANWRRAKGGKVYERLSR